MAPSATTTTAVEEPLSPTKVKSGNFLSFFSRLSGKSKSLSQLTTTNVEVAPPPKSPSFRNPFGGNLIPKTPAEASPITPTTNYSSTSNLLPFRDAFSQAILEACLALPTKSPEVILRRNSEVKEKSSRMSVLHRHGNSTSDFEWIKKIFILVPGLILQYSSDGAVERLPEKLLELTGKSVVFASDALVGRPYVLQVSKNADDDGCPIPLQPEKRPNLFSKMTSRSVDKHATGTLLLVFDGAREMDSWLTAVRNEIAKLAGTYVPEEDDSSYGTRRTRRYPIRNADGSMASLNSSKRMSRVSQPSLLETPGPSPSLSTANPSSEHLYLERLRESPTLKPPSVSSPETSPERVHSDYDQDKVSSNRRRSVAAVSASRVSMEMRIPRRPVSAFAHDSGMLTAYGRPGAPPTLALPIPIPVSPRNYEETMQVPKRSPLDSVSMLSTSVPCRHSPAPSPRGSVIMQNGLPIRPPPRTSSTSPVIPQSQSLHRLNVQYHQAQPQQKTPKKQRPVSLMDPKQSEKMGIRANQPWVDGVHLTVPPSPTSSKSPRSLKRRSMTALAAGQCRHIPDPPAYPPPQIPLPQIPSEATAWKPPAPQRVATPRKSSPSLGQRHSFHAVRSQGNTDSDT